MKLKRIFDILANQVEQNPIEKCLSMKKNGIWEFTSTQEFMNKANQITSAFLELGLKSQDKIALITSANRTESVSYTHPPSPRDRQKSRMPSSA